MIVKLVHSEHIDHVNAYTISTHLKYLTAITNMTFNVTLIPHEILSRKQP
jgi:hypothetical protein